MKEIKELKFEELTAEQKIGIVTCALISGYNRTPESDEFALELIKNHALGCLWVTPSKANFEFLRKAKELADYPLLIVTDAESGFGDYKIGRHNALGMTDSTELAYEFGKVTAIGARQKGYNVVCDPVVDIAPGKSICGTNIRSLGSDKEKIATLAKAIARGMHDGGVLTVAKHYPSAAKKAGPGARLIDSHMAETCSTLTKEELIDNCLYPYIELMKEGLLDGIMTGHCRLPNIDPDFPASLSKKVIGIIRELGFDGFAITDALSMMGIVAKFGDTDSKGLSIENGNDLALVWTSDVKKGYDAVYDCYKKGILSDERLDEATKIVLAAQHKVFELEPKFTEITKEDEEAFERITTDSIFAKTDDNVPVALSKEGKHLFIVLTDNETDISDDGKVDVDSFSGGWYYPGKIMEKIESLFPNSETLAIREFPTGWNICCALEKAVNFDDVVFVSFKDGVAYVGREEFTPRIISMIEAMQVSNQISTVVHFGNPYTLEDLPHIPRIIIGGAALKSTLTAFDVLAGDYPAKGKLTYDVNFE